MFKQKCQVCGAVFDAYASRSKYCSLECAEIGRKRRRAEWEKRNPNYYSEYYKKKLADNPNYNADLYKRHKITAAERRAILGATK